MNRRINSGMFPTTPAELAAFVSGMVPAVTQMTASKYPPHNIIQVDTTVYIEMAVAGFTKDQVKVTVEDGTLTVTGSKPATEYVEEAVFIHKGIATRPFSFSTQLADGAKVASAKFKDGILTITVELEVVEKKAAQSINID